VQEGQSDKAVNVDPLLRYTPFTRSPSMWYRIVEWRSYQQVYTFPLSSLGARQVSKKDSEKILLAPDFAVAFAENKSAFKENIVFFPRVVSTASVAEG
jgi:hypothetical protein